MAVRFPVTMITSAVLTFFATCDCTAGITWNVSYEDVENGSTFGFDDPTLGSTRRSTFESALDYISANLAVGYSINNNVTIDYRVSVSSNTPSSSNLASAGAAFPTSGQGYYNGTLFHYAATGVDQVTGADAFATFNFGRNWNSDLDTPTSTEFDLFSVALHEVAHSLGFLSLISSDGTGFSGSNIFTALDFYLERGNGSRILGGTPAEPTAATADDLISNDVYFAGPNAVAANGGSPIQMYAPSTFADGSSLSHLAPNIYPSYVMGPFFAPGTMKRTFSDIEFAMFEDMGWTVVSSNASNVPEPSSLSLVAIISLLGLARKRLRRELPKEMTVTT